MAEGFIKNDGGREAAGFRGVTGDCVTRAIAIATGKPYQEVYDALNELGKKERTGKRKKTKSNARTGVHKQTTRKYMLSIGWRWVPTMGIGTGCKVHLDANELPNGRLVVMLSRHATAMCDGIIHDTYDPRRPMLETRNGVQLPEREFRCVYGYYTED